MKKMKYNKHRKRSHRSERTKRDMYRWFITSNRSFSRADTQGILPGTYLGGLL